MRKTKNAGALYGLSLIGRNPSAASVDVLTNILVLMGIRLQNLTESQNGKTVCVTTYFKSLPQARKIKEQIRRLKLKNVAVKVRKLMPKDWKGRFKLNIKPFKLTPSIDIVPVWKKREYRKTGRRPVYLSTINAFGTGLHETTKFMSRFIEEKRGQFKNFFDIGTGTGILSMVALLNGAHNVSGIDINPDSVQAAKANLKTNGYSFKQIKVADIRRLRLKKRFDFVAANLITHELMRSATKIVPLVKKRGWLAVSGVSKENYRMFKRAFKKMPLRCLKVTKGKSWVAELYQRS